MTRWLSSRWIPAQVKHTKLPTVKLTHDGNLEEQSAHRLLGGKRCNCRTWSSGRCSAAAGEGRDEVLPAPPNRRPDPGGCNIRSREEDKRSRSEPTELREYLTLVTLSKQQQTLRTTTNFERQQTSNAVALAAGRLCRPRQDLLGHSNDPLSHRMIGGEHEGPFFYTVQAVGRGLYQLLLILSHTLYRES